MLTATSLLTGDLPDISAEFGTNFYGPRTPHRHFALGRLTHRSHHRGVQNLDPPGPEEFVRVGGDTTDDRSTRAGPAVTTARSGQSVGGRRLTASG